MNIEKRGDSYRIVVSLGYDESGKKIRKSMTFKPLPNLTPMQEKKAVLDAAAEFEQRCQGGAPVQFDKLKFKDFCSGLYAQNHLSTLKEKTRDGYIDIINKRLNVYFGEMYIRKITPLSIRTWLSSLERLSTSNRSGKLSPNSAAVWFRTLSAIMGKAYEWQIIDENPCKRVKAPHKATVNVQAWELEDAQKVMEKLPQYPDIRISMFVELVLKTGMREAEAAGLEWQDIDLDNNCLYIVRTSQYITGKGMIEGTPKSDSSRRAINFDEDLKESLIRYKKWQASEFEKIGSQYIGASGDEVHLFTTWNGAPINDKTLRKWLRKFELWAGVPTITVHGLRHTLASILIANNTDARTVAQILGHSDPALVMRVYANPQSEAKMRAVNTLNGLLKKAE